MDGRIVIVRPDGSGAPALLDDPQRLRFRQPLTPAEAARLSLRPLYEPEPGELDDRCGWYGDSGDWVLLTQVPDSSFGEPMVLVGAGEAVLRAYPVAPGRFVRGDGAELDLVCDEAGGPALRIGGGPGTAMLARDERYRERPITFRAGPDDLAATLVTPAGPGPHPAAVILHGAAGGQRDFCRLLVQPALDAGVAVLLYDRRGTGRSTGTPEFTIFDQATAAEAALDRIAAEPDVDADRLGLIAFSNGGWSAPMVAARRDLAFLVGIGVPGVSMAESELHRRTRVLRDSGVGPETVDAAGEAWRCVFALASAGRPEEAVTTRLAAALDRLRSAADLDRYVVPDYARANPMLSAVPPLAPVDELVPMLVGEADPELGHDPVEDYARVRCPTLHQWGGADTNVPARLSRERIAAALPDPAVATLREYPEAEHLLNVAPSGVQGISAEEAGNGFHRFRFAPGVRDDLRDWLSAVTSR
ncbi:alpha/beta hydrolase family protein [Plantactinospora siamensis]|uniref:Alpha/beta hydrolase family protein n=1 Tax=Plantactinospora siamensis TaxID=555372 RepID=A0ABV6NX16_9ACTN